MNAGKLKLSAILLMLPSLAFASGDSILPTLYLQFASIVVFFVFILFVKLRIVAKLILVWVYVVTVFLIWYLTRNLPFLGNEKSFDLSIGVIPIVTVLIAFALLYRRFNKIRTSRVSD